MTEQIITKRINLPNLKHRVEEFCIKWKIVELYFYGSVLRDDYRCDSDIDVMVTFEDKAGWSLFDLVEMNEGLETIFNRKVDLVTKKSVEDSENWYIRKQVLDSSTLYYRAKAA
jgi:uncharacterized protein